MNNDNNRRPGRNPVQPNRPHNPGGNRPPEHPDRPHNPGHTPQWPSRPPFHPGGSPIIIQPEIIIPERPQRPPQSGSKAFLYDVMDDYAGQDVSELGAVLLYLYENMVLDGEDSELAKELLEISENEMRHFHILGEMIVDLGGDPQYRGGQPGSYFNAGRMVYPTRLREMMQINIQSETAAIQNYYRRVQDAPTQSIAQTYERIIEDEKRHLAFFQKQYRMLTGI